VRVTQRTRAIIRLAILSGLIAVAFIVAWRLGYFELSRREQLAAAIRHVRTVGWATPLYVVSYTLIVALGLPATIMSILGGALFGSTKGLMLAWTGAMIGTVVAHTIARSVGKTAVRRFLGKHTLLRKLGDRTKVRTLVRLRVLPLAPFGVLDYVAGLAGVPLRTLLLATAIGIVPGTAAYTYAGDQARVGLEAGGAGRRALLVAGLVTITVTGIALAPWVASKLRSTISEGDG
jgi:uncharacterized membrane protein YdjX (TVP38/TMEM64 family)